MSTVQTIYLVDTDRGDAPLLRDYFTSKGYTLEHFSDMGMATQAIVQHIPDLILVEPGLPNTQGFELCRDVRPRYMGPILFWSENTDEASQLLAFEMGADEYLLKPMSLPLLSARIKAHLKRIRRPEAEAVDSTIQLGKLVVDQSRREVMLDGRPVTLTTTQFDLLWYLVNHPGRVVTRQELYQALFQETYNGFDRSVDVYISRLRNLLGDDAEQPRYLKTIRGVGYLFAD